ncbi:hypothetical protein VNO78_10663 [Psophocarpus tetragonolobus]|uniref:Transmembrane protein n=1 Tax=Psophocarpus tetragonolobus TaxID=3891 RepID=A0AAN9SMH5_PSOTE
MLDFGEELTLEGFRIPWLIWIQLLVFLLLLALLFCLSIIALDPSHHTTFSPSTTDSHLHIQQSSNHHSTAITNHLQNTRGNTSIKGEIASNPSTGIVREEIAEGEASTSSLSFLHPCYYFKLARAAFLRCFGLDSTSKSDDPSNQKHRKTKET